MSKFHARIYNIVRDISRQRASWSDRVGSGRIGSTFEIYWGHKKNKICFWPMVYDRFQEFYAFSTIIIYSCRRSFSYVPRGRRWRPLFARNKDFLVRSARISLAPSLRFALKYLTTFILRMSTHLIQKRHWCKTSWNQVINFLQQLVMENDLFSEAIHNWKCAEEVAGKECGH